MMERNEAAVTDSTCGIRYEPRYSKWTGTSIGVENPRYWEATEFCSILTRPVLLAVTNKR